eukprot:5220652-Ditylum_brightwellii.AAC.2
MRYNITRMPHKKRISIAVGLQNGGYDLFYGDMFVPLNVVLTSNVKEYLKEKDAAMFKKEHMNNKKSLRGKKKRKVEHIAEDNTCVI